MTPLSNTGNGCSTSKRDWKAWFEAMAKLGKVDKVV